MKILLAEDPTGYANAASQLTDKMSRLQAVLVAYAALGLATVPTTADLADLWENPKVFLGRMLTAGQPVTVSGGLALDPGQVYGLLQKPAGAGAFFAAWETQRNSRSGGWSFPNLDTAVYELAGGTLRIKPAVLAALQEQFRLYAVSQRQKDEWDALQVAVAALETIRQNGRHGADFSAPDYLRAALANAGQANNFNPLAARAAYIVGTVA